MINFEQELSQNNFIQKSQQNTISNQIISQKDIQKHPLLDEQKSQKYQEPLLMEQTYCKKDKKRMKNKQQINLKQNEENPSQKELQLGFEESIGSDCESQNQSDDNMKSHHFEICQLFDNSNTIVKQIYNKKLQQFTIKKYYTANSGVTKEEWEQEIEFLKKLSESEITLPFVSSGIEDGMFYIEQVAGQKDLRKVKLDCQQLYISNKKEGHDKYDRILSIYFIRLLQKLIKMHELGYAHSDIKPQNFILGYDFDCYFIDFGGSVELLDYENYLSQLTLYYNLQRYYKRYDNGEVRGVTLNSQKEVKECEYSQLALTFLFMIIPDLKQDHFEFGMKNFNQLIEKYALFYPQTTLLIKLCLNEDDVIIEKEIEKFGCLTIGVDQNALYEFCEIIQDIKYDKERNKFIVKRINKDSIYVIDLIDSIGLLENIDTKTIDIIPQNDKNEYQKLCSNYRQINQYFQKDNQKYGGIHYLFNIKSQIEKAQNKTFYLTIGYEQELIFLYEILSKVQIKQNLTFNIGIKMIKGRLEQFLSQIKQYTTNITQFEISHYQKYKKIQIQFTINQQTSDKFNLCYNFNTIHPSTRKLESDPYQIFCDNIFPNQQDQQIKDLSLSLNVGNQEQYSEKVMDLFIKRKLKQFSQFINKFNTQTQIINTLNITIQKPISRFLFKFQGFGLIKNLQQFEDRNNMYDQQDNHIEIFGKLRVLGGFNEMYQELSNTIKKERQTMEYYLIALVNLVQQPLFKVNHVKITLQNFIMEDIVSTLERAFNNKKNISYDVILKDCIYNVDSIKEINKIRNNRPKQEVIFEYIELNQENNYKAWFQVEYSYNNSDLIQSKDKLNYQVDNNVHSKLQSKQIKITFQQSKLPPEEDEKQGKNNEIISNNMDLQLQIAKQLIEMLNQRNIIIISEKVSQFKEFNKLKSKSCIPLEYYYKNKYNKQNIQFRMNFFRNKDKSDMPHQKIRTLSQEIEVQLTSTKLFIFQQNQQKYTIFQNLFYEDIMEKFLRNNNNNINIKLNIDKYEPVLQNIFAMPYELRLMEDNEILKIQFKDIQIDQIELISANIKYFIQHKTILNQSLKQISIEFHNYYQYKVNKKTFTIPFQKQEEFNSEDNFIKSRESQIKKEEDGIQQEENEIKQEESLKFNLDLILIKFSKSELIRIQNVILSDAVKNLDQLKCKKKKFILRGQIATQQILFKFIQCLPQMQTSMKYSFDLRENYDISQSQWMVFIREVINNLKNHHIIFDIRSEIKDKDILIKQFNEEFSSMEYSKRNNNDIFQYNKINDLEQNEFHFIIDFLDEPIEFDKDLYEIYLNHQKSITKYDSNILFYQQSRFMIFNYDNEIQDNYIAIPEFNQKVSFNQNVNQQIKLINNNMKSKRFTFFGAEPFDYYHQILTKQKLMSNYLIKQFLIKKYDLDYSQGKYSDSDDDAKSEKEETVYSITESDIFRQEEIEIQEIFQIQQDQIEQENQGENDSSDEEIDEAEVYEEFINYNNQQSKLSQFFNKQENNQNFFKPTSYFGKDDFDEKKININSNLFDDQDQDNYSDEYNKYNDSYSDEEGYSNYNYPQNDDDDDSY